MNLIRRAVSAMLPALLACALTGCTATSRHGAAPVGNAGRPLVPAQQTDPGSASFLHADHTEVDYVRWQPDGAGHFSGTELDAKVRGNVPEAQVSVDQSNFTGQLTGSAITFFVAGSSVDGTLSGGTLTVNTVAEDGSIQPEVFHRASDADYNTALAGLRTIVRLANNQQNTANAQADAERKLTRAYQDMNDDASTLTSDVSNMGGDVTSAEGDVLNTHADERNVLAEASDGTDSTVCGDAAGVGGDASGVSGDASGISGDLDGITTDLSTFHGDAVALAADLHALLSIEPGYTGRGDAPSPLAVRHTLSGAAATAETAVTDANGYIARMNTAVTTAYGYARKASQAGNCGTSEAPPAPIATISSPFAGQASVST